MVIAGTALVASLLMMHVMAVLGLTPSGPLHHAVAFEGATLAAVGAARRITEPHEAQFRTDHAVVLRGIHSCELDPLRKLGDPQPCEMDGVDAEMRIAAALVSRLLGAAFLRDPCGSWCSMLPVPSWWRHGWPTRPRTLGVESRPLCLLRAQAAACLCCRRPVPTTSNRKLAADEATPTSLARRLSTLPRNLTPQVVRRLGQRVRPLLVLAYPRPVPARDARHGRAPARADDRDALRLPGRRGQEDRSQLDGLPEALPLELRRLDGHCLGGRGHR